MNRSILIVICDFLLLSLLTFSTDINHMANETSRPATTVQVVTNPVVNASGDLAAAMKLALQNEQQTQAQLQEQLASARQAAAAQQNRNAQLQAQYLAARTNAAGLSRELQAATTQSQQELAAREAEAQRATQVAASLQLQLAQLSQSNELADAQRQRLANELQVAEIQKSAAVGQAALMQQEVLAERSENTRLSEGFKLLATNSAALTQEIRENQTLAPNTIFSDFVSNRVTAAIDGVYSSFFSMDSSRNTMTETVLVTDGTNIFAVCHVDATPLKLWNPGTDWNEFTGNLTRGPDRVPIRSLSFDSNDPRVVMIPVSRDEARRLGCKIYRLSSDPYKFQNAVLIGANEGYYGQCNFQIDLSAPQYVRLDRSVLKGLFGQFNPSRGDYVFSSTGELLGIMVNNTYCLILHQFAPSTTLAFNRALSSTGSALSQLYDYVFQMPARLQ
ncbi:MAG: hypothetical protein ACLQSR_02695 [Limisphaerales bacterium]